MKIRVEYTWMDETFDEHTSAETVEFSGSMVDALEKAKSLVKDIQHDVLSNVFKVTII